MIHCPHCNGDIEATLVASVPDVQIMTFAAASEHELFTAKTIGGVIANASALLVAVAKDVGERVEVFVRAIRVEPHKFAVDLLIVKVKAGEKSSAVRLRAALTGGSR